MQPFFSVTWLFVLTNNFLSLSQQDKNAHSPGEINFCVHFIKNNNNDGGEIVSKNVSRNYSHYKEQLIPVFWIKQGGSAIQKASYANDSSLGEKGKKSLV